MERPPPPEMASATAERRSRVAKGLPGQGFGCGTAAADVGEGRSVFRSGIGFAPAAAFGTTTATRRKQQSSPSREAVFQDTTGERRARPHEQRVAIISVVAVFVGRVEGTSAHNHRVGPGGDHYRRLVRPGVLWAVHVKPSGPDHQAALDDVVPIARLQAGRSAERATVTFVRVHALAVKTVSPPPVPHNARPSRCAASS